jgi:tRNA-splicing ligase RtcB
MSRTKARKQWRGDKLQRDLESGGIYVRTASWPGLAEEAGGAYKSVDDVIAATDQAGLSKCVVRFTPIGNVKG